MDLTLYNNRNELSEIYADIKNRLDDVWEKPELIVYQYIKELSHRAYCLMTDELVAKQDELFEQTNILKDKSDKVFDKVLALEEELAKKKAEYEKLDAMYEKLDDKLTRLNTRMCGFVGEDPNEVSVKIFATMSSGKSTLINSMLQQKLMPTSNLACTAKITKIMDDSKKKDNFSVYAYTKEDETLLYSTDDPDYKTMQMINNDTTVEYVQVNGRIPFNKSEKIILSIIDTPGPNNSRNANHGEVMDKELKYLWEDTIVIYVINATQFGINDDVEVLKKLRDKMIYSPKVLFVVNKMDQIDTKEEDINEFLENVKEYLEIHGFKDPKIYPISSLAALNIRTLLQASNIDEEDDEVYNARALIRKLNRNDALHLENYSPVSEKISNKIAMELQATKENNDKVGQALVHSGIRNIEESILEIAEEIVEYKLNDDYWEYIQDTDYEKVFQSDLDSENDFEGKTPKWDNVARKWFFS
ncbi:dynamin family protein [Ligilactobacillus murinus]|uniref:Uncharacterized protein n=1 Tax=Ligilactobacillus murinus TaxID=1622 RepID=A0AAE7BP71_9LACO|nr:dynamin family protein [Ligilactobacillus murinus]NEF83667.1 hypothetical protein [Ligilactobacillus murinus]NEF86080.1 hypothetical protein [Ligilactobacillus murinus]NEF88242.1 hypothetical protein [Ligilactobacillus murinus]NEF90519.1 hypothetical protein [Ligilactobacillus murinus]NEF92779.1 hypothetical protein [Ligilactobacillus murinus]